MVPYCRHVWAITGSTRGVGKSYVTASMGFALARSGKSVILVDADSSDPNLHTFVGIDNPVPSLREILEAGLKAEELLVPSPESDVRFLSWCGDYLEGANLLFGRREKVIKALLTLPADYILVDLGSGRSERHLDLFNVSHERFVVATPDPSTLHEAFSFIRCALMRHIQRKFGASGAVSAALRQIRESTFPRTLAELSDLLRVSDVEATEKLSSLFEEYRPVLLLNKADSDQDQRAAEIIQSVCARLLNIDIVIGGPVFMDPQARSVGGTRPQQDEGVACRQLEQLVRRLIEAAGDGKDPVPDTAPADSALTGFNDNITFLGRTLHIQTEDLGERLRAVATQVFCGGRVLFGKRAEYSIAGSDRDSIVELMRKQHFEVLSELENKKSAIASDKPSSLPNE